jgi:hypothetical protein
MTCGCGSANLARVARLGQGGYKHGRRLVGIASSCTQVFAFVCVAMLASLEISCASLDVCVCVRALLFPVC